MRATFLISMWILFAPDTAWSQPTSLLPAGTRVRLATQSGPATGSRSELRIGSVISAGPDSLKIRFPDDDSSSTLAWSAVSSLEVSRPVPLAERAKTGAIIGGLAGAVVGGVIGAGKKGRSRELIDPAVTGATEGLIYGAVAGGAIGAVTSVERWERVWPVFAFQGAPPPRPRSSFGATPTFARP
jgi:hypothetical protein